MKAQIVLVLLAINFLSALAQLDKEKDTASSGSASGSQSSSSSSADAEAGGSGTTKDAGIGIEGIPKNYGPLLASLLPALRANQAGAQGASHSFSGSSAGASADAGFPGLGGLGGLSALSGYFPGFVGGPSYVPQSVIGSALGAKGDVLFPIIIFIFVIFGIWTVVHFLLGLIVPLIAGKLKEGKSLLENGRRSRRAIPDPWEDLEDDLDQATQDVLPALDANQQKYETEIESEDTY